jgi:hypothetical protein
MQTSQECNICCESVPNLIQCLRPCTFKWCHNCHDKMNIVNEIVICPQCNYSITLFESIFVKFNTNSIDEIANFVEKWAHNLEVCEAVLRAAVLCKSKPIVELILKNKNSHQFIDANLVRVCYVGDVEILNLFINSNVDLSRTWRKALRMAEIQGHADILQILRNQANKL